jgi:DNA-binding transcriptional MerR regulator
MNSSIATSSAQLKIGEVSKLTGVGIEALRFYEKGGLLDRPARTVSGYRLYNQDVLERVAFIKKAQVLGFRLDEIRQLILHKRAGESPCAEVREVVAKRLSELETKIAEMLQYREDLKTALADWSQMGEADGHVCGLIEGVNFGSNPKKELEK